MSGRKLETIPVQRQPSPEHLRQLGVSDRPIWTQEVSEFPRTGDEPETCDPLAGEVTVTPGGGDRATFSRGFSRTWTVRAPVKKHDHFG